MIAAADRTGLLALARASIEAWLEKEAPPVVPATGASGVHAGAFVTLHAHGELRGCIGHIGADRPLGEVVSSCAVSAASSDPRFPPLSAREFEALDIEISVLHDFAPVRTSGDIEIGRHGLLVESGWRRGLLLPQVAPEWGWDVPTFIAQTCFKAGLPRDAWPGGGATLQRFEAEVFGEKGA